MTVRTWAAAAVLLLGTVAAAGCTADDEGDDMRSSEAMERLQRETARVAELLGGGPPQVSQEEYLTCEMGEYDGSVYPVYSGSVELVPDAVQVVEAEVVASMEADGWTLRRRESSSREVFDFDKDGFIVNVTVPTGEGSRIAVGGSGPCVEDDGTTGIVHDQ